MTLKRFVLLQQPINMSKANILPLSQNKKIVLASAALQ